MFLVVLVNLALAAATTAAHLGGPFDRLVLVTVVAAAALCVFEVLAASTLARIFSIIESGQPR